MADVTVDDVDVALDDAGLAGSSEAAIAPPLADTATVTPGVTSADVVTPDPNASPDPIDPADDPLTPWTPEFDEADDLDGLLAARSPLLARAFRTADRGG